MEATRGAPVSESRELSRTSAVGTRRMCCWGGRHWARMGLLEKAPRNGFRGCIHSTGCATPLAVASVRVWPPLGSGSRCQPCNGLSAVPEGSMSISADPRAERLSDAICPGACGLRQGIVLCALSMGLRLSSRLSLRRFGGKTRWHWFAEVSKSAIVSRLRVYRVPTGAKVRLKGARLQVSPGIRKLRYLHACGAPPLSEAERCKQLGPSSTYICSGGALNIHPS